MPDADLPDVLAAHYPFRAIVAAGNPYGIPVGKEFLLARRKDGEASPFPVEVFSWVGDYQIYQFRENEVRLENRDA